MDFEDVDLPHVLREVADAVNLQAALQLAMDWGGRELYVPLEFDEKHALTTSIGKAAAQFLIKTWGGESIEIPLGPTNYEQEVMIAIDKLIAKGWSESRISAKLRVHIRTVRRHRAKMKVEHPRLFQ